MKSKIIVLMGIDGSGKTTQAEFLAKSLSEKGIKAEVIWLRGESYLTRPVLAIGKALLGAPKAKKREQIDQAEDYNRYVSSKRRIFRNPLMRLLWRTLCLADYLINVKVAFARLSRETRVVILDRYIYDTLIDIDSAFGAGGKEVSRMLDSWLMDLFPKPDKVFHIDIPPAEAMRRKDDIPSITYLEERHKLYEQISKLMGATTIDGSLPREAIAAAIRKEISEVVNWQS